jgi:hypothetical protein
VFTRIPKRPSPIWVKETSCTTVTILYDQRSIYGYADIASETVSASEESTRPVCYLRTPKSDHGEPVCTMLPQTRGTSSRQAIVTPPLISVVCPPEVVRNQHSYNRTRCGTGQSRCNISAKIVRGTGTRNGSAPEYGGGSGRNLV